MVQSPGDPLCGDEHSKEAPPDALDLIRAKIAPPLEIDLHAGGGVDRPGLEKVAIASPVVVFLQLGRFEEPGPSARTREYRGSVKPLAVSSRAGPDTRKVNACNEEKLPLTSLVHLSSPERLIAFSNTYLYDKSLITFPGVAGADCLVYVAVANPHFDASGRSSDAEVRSVVAVILEHARTQPEMSLGVITMGITHANRIKDELWSELARDLNDDNYLSNEV